MSLYGALFGGVSGLRAQSSKIGAISDNIANANTIGYKRSTAVFQTLVVNASNAGSYQTGGVRASTQMNVSQQGLLSTTNSATDIAISGGGFFVVRNAATAVVGESSSTPYYTRAGSFTQDSRGNFVNAQGFFLQGWPLDREGRLPGAEGNVTNLTSYTNFDSVETVNVESASGVAQATSTISLGANLKSSEGIFPGSAAVLKPDTTDFNNRNLAADQIVVGSDYGLATSNDLRRGDSFNISIANGASNYSFEYGGYTVGRKITSSSNNYGDGGTDNTRPLNFDAQTGIEYDGTNSYIITIPNHNLLNGDKVTLANISAATAGSAPAAAELNGTNVVERLDANRIRVTITNPHGQTDGTNPATTDPFTADVRSEVFDGNIFNASTTTGNFLAEVTGYSDAAKTFTISTEASGMRTFTYVSSNANAANGEFSSLNTLATAINAVNGLSARVVDGRLVVGAEDATKGIQILNGDASGGPAQRGLDWISELGLADIADQQNRFNSLASLASLADSADGISATLTNPLSTASLSINVDSPLQDIIFSDQAGPKTVNTGAANITVSSGAANPATPVDITVTLPGHGFDVNDRVSLSDLLPASAYTSTGLPNGALDGNFIVTAIAGGPPATSFTVQYTPKVDLGTIAGGAVTPSSANRVSAPSADTKTNQGSVLAAFGIGGMASLGGVDYSTYLTANADTIPSVQLDPRYDSSAVDGANMASGDITAQFSRNVRIYDAQGFGHDVRFSFIKSSTNTWEVEVHAIPASDIVVSTSNNGNATEKQLVDGQIAVGRITFNGDGTLQTVSTGLQGDIPITWTNGASSSRINLDLGTAGALGFGLADGMSQFASGYNVNFANQNGAPVGQLVSVSIDETGKVIASYSNGQIQALYQLPLADFANPDGLVARSGNIFEQSADSGEVNLREANSNGTGTIVSGALEQSNVDLAEELTDMIVAQRAYQANTKVIRTADELLESLNQI